MATPYAPADSQYILKNADATNLPNGSVLDVGTGLSLTSGVGTYTLDVTDNLNSLANMALGVSGIMRYNAGSSATTACQLVSTGGSLTITNPTGVGGNPDFAVVNNTSTQRVIAAEAGVTKSTRATLNFISGDGATVTVSDNGGSGSADITISASGGGGGGAPTDATYILKTANVDLPDAQDLGSLATGLLKSTTTTGVVSIAVNGTDYYSPADFPIETQQGGTGANLSTGYGDMLVGSIVGGQMQILAANNESDKILKLVSGTPNWVSVVPTVCGGTGWSNSPNDGDMLVGRTPGGAHYAGFGIGSPGQVLTVGGASLPAWQDVTCTAYYIGLAQGETTATITPAHFGGPYWRYGISKGVAVADADLGIVANLRNVTATTIDVVLSAPVSDAGGLGLVFFTFNS